MFSSSKFISITHHVLKHNPSFLNLLFEGSIVSVLFQREVNRLILSIRTRPLTAKMWPFTIQRITISTASADAHPDPLVTVIVSGFTFLVGRVAREAESITSVDSREVSYISRFFLVSFGGQCMYPSKRGQSGLALLSIAIQKRARVCESWIAQNCEMDGHLSDKNITFSGSNAIDWSTGSIQWSQKTKKETVIRNPAKSEQNRPSKNEIREICLSTNFWWFFPGNCYQLSKISELLVVQSG